MGEGGLPLSDVIGIGLLHLTSKKINPSYHLFYAAVGSAEDGGLGNPLFT